MSLTFFSATEAQTFWIALSVFTAYLAICVTGWTHRSVTGKRWPIRKFVISNNAERFLLTGLALAAALAWVSVQDYKNTVATVGALLLLEVLRFNIGVSWHRRNDEARRGIADPKRINSTQIDEHAAHPGIGADHSSYDQWPVVTDIYTGARIASRRGTGRRVHYVRGGGVITIAAGDFQASDELLLPASEARTSMRQLPACFALSSRSTNGLSPSRRRSRPRVMRSRLVIAITQPSPVAPPEGRGLLAVLRSTPAQS